MSSNKTSEVLQKIASYEEQARNAANQRMEVDMPDAASSLEKELDDLISAYQLRVQQRRTELERVSSFCHDMKIKLILTVSFKLQNKSDIEDLVQISVPSSDPRQRLRQLQAMTGAYSDLTSQAPELPDPNSLVPVLLAVNDLRESITDSKATIESALDRVESIEHQERSEEAILSDADSLATAMNLRISRLQAAQEERTSKPPEELARNLLRTKQQRKKEYNIETKRLRKALDQFINDHLGAMIAAEELGGPVAGERDDVDEDMLMAGFSTQGNPKQFKGGAKANSESKRQRRIDEIWGTGDSTLKSEHAAACKELNNLLDDLIMALNGASDSGVYVELSRDSAAARFLVRAKVAQFHPKDARRLRLIDFGRDLDD
jgi:hypothetical protein